MAKTSTYTKQALLNGAGSLYLQMITTEETPSTPPIYDEEVFETPSLDNLSMSLELNEKQVWLSNKMHSDLSNVRLATITVAAGYFPRGFAEEAQGMVEVGGGWSMPTTPKKKPFRLAVPFSDENGDELILNFPKCTLSPLDISGETKKEDTTEQIPQFVIKSVAPDYKGDLQKEFVYHKLDLANPENKTKYDRDLLLINGWYDNTSLALNEKDAIPVG